jgi:putative nucleotidyltransferase with HDIG domain
MQQLDDYINKVKHLPPAPRILTELLSLLQKDNVDASRVVTLVSYDPSLTASVLQLCNSAFYAPAQPVDDLGNAIMWLGFKEVYRLVAAVVGSRTLMVAGTGGVDRGELWRHSVMAAAAAQLLARDLRDEENLPFTAALLHDVGKTIFSEVLQADYARLVDQAAQTQQPLAPLEKSRFEVHHAELGARLLTRWRFPQHLINAVWFHHTPRLARAGERLAAQVTLGNVVAHLLKGMDVDQAVALHGHPSAFEILTFDPGCLPRIVEAANDRMEMLRTLFRLAG